MKSDCYRFHALPLCCYRLKMVLFWYHSFIIMMLLFHHRAPLWCHSLAQWHYDVNCYNPVPLWCHCFWAGPFWCKFSGDRITHKTFEKPSLVALGWLLEDITFWLHPGAVWVLKCLAAFCCSMQVQSGFLKSAHSVVSAPLTLGWGLCLTVGDSLSAVMETTAAIESLL